jgi:hypothetical protein
MQVFRLTNELARVLGVSEWRIRAMLKRDEIKASARTASGVALFSDEDVTRAERSFTRAARTPRSTLPHRSAA